MLQIEVSKIPREGMDIDTTLEAGEVHLQGEESFGLEPGGRLQAHVEKGDDNSVHIRGRLDACLRLDCGRCLDAFPLTLAQQLDLFYLPHQKGEDDEDEVELTERDMVVAYYAGGKLDLGDLIRE